MRNKVILGIFLLMIVYIVNNFFSEEMLIGKYVNTNFSDDFIAEIPHKADTLILKKNNAFESRFYGKGKYKIIHSLGGTEIDLSYGEGYSSTIINGEHIKVSNKAGFSTYINRIMFFGNPKIILCEDLNHYYEKTE
jgi:hypothetical protein